MKAMDISWRYLYLVLLFLFLFCLNFVSAININFDFPEKIYQNTEFNVEINDVDVAGTYDVKVYILNENEKIVSRIYAEKWQSSMYYFNSAYPSQNSFNLIVENYTGSGKLCVKLRPSGKSSGLEEVCKDITVLMKYEEKISVEGDELLNNEMSENMTMKSNNKVIESVQLNGNAVMEYEVEESDKPIILENKPAHTTSYFGTRLILIYGFVVLCVIIIILLALRIL